MKRILFVDDQQALLDALQNVLRRQRKIWEMEFVTSGAEALARMQSQPFDVVVSDMRMPAMDGAALLREVQRSNPATMRIVLSGFADEAASIASVPVAHQFLSKPCDGEVLRAVIERACRIQDLIKDARLHELVGRLDKLPSVPRLYTRLVAVIGDPKSSVADVVAVLQQDIAMCAKALQLVNSSFFRLARRITNVQEAVAYLGLETVKALVLTSQVFSMSGEATRAAGLSLELEQDHALAVALLARKLLPKGAPADDAFTAGMLHDVGRIILAAELPAQHRAVMDAAARDPRPLSDRERDIYGVGHAEVGAYLLGAWGLPSTIVEAVANHHEPSRSQANAFDVVGAVHVADALVRAESGGSTPLDMSYLQGLGLENQYPRWRLLAAEALASSKGPRSER